MGTYRGMGGYWNEYGNVNVFFAWKVRSFDQFISFIHDVYQILKFIFFFSFLFLFLLLSCA